MTRVRLDRVEEGRKHFRKDVTMLLKWALIFFIVAIVAAIFGFGGIAAGATEIAKILFFVFLVVFVIALIAGLIQGRRTRI